MELWSLLFSHGLPYCMHVVGHLDTENFPLKSPAQCHAAEGWLLCLDGANFIQKTTKCDFRVGQNDEVKSLIAETLRTPASLT